jgi:hypothetical protein
LEIFFRSQTKRASSLWFGRPTSLPIFIHIPNEIGGNAMSKVRLSLITVKMVFHKKAVWLSTIILLAGLSITLAAKFRSLEKPALATTGAKAQQGCCATVPATLRRMIGTYYNTEDGFQSSLVLNNKGPNVIAVTPILHGKNGQTFTAAQVFVKGESSLNVDLNAIANNAGSHFKSGSFEFTYQGRMMEMGGGLRIVNAAKSLIFDEQLLEPGMKFSSPNLEAVYAIPSDKADAAVIVTNTTTQPLSLNGTATFVGAGGHHPINGTLGAYETSVINLPNGLVKQFTAGAVSITHNGAKGALLTMVHVWDKDKGFSAAVNFADPAQGKTTQLHGAGLRLGNVNGSALKPVIAVRNIGNAATTVTTRVPHTKQDGSTTTITLPQTSLAAGETKLINTTHPGLGQTDIATAGIEIEYTGAAGSVIAAAHSASTDGNHVFTLPLKDPQGGMSSTGGYPWFINEQGSTVVFIKNTTTEPQKFHLDVIYPGGRWGANLRTLAPGQTLALDVRAIRDSQEKGVEGNPIPLDASAGHVSWSAYSRGKKTLIGRAQTVEFRKAMASTYECQCPCNASYVNARLLPASISGFPGDTQQFLAQQQNMDCFGNLTAWFDVNAAGGFSSDNASVATVNSSGLGTALAPGTTNIRASWYASIISYEGDPLHCESYDTTADCSASCEVLAPDIRVSDAYFTATTVKNRNPNDPNSHAESTILKVGVTADSGICAGGKVKALIRIIQNQGNVTLTITNYELDAYIVAGNVVYVDFPIVPTNENTNIGQVTFEAKVKENSWVAPNNPPSGCSSTVTINTQTKEKTLTVANP